MSIDLYPALDAGETDVAVALERDVHAGAIAPLGAASLLHRNDDMRWPGIGFANLASDGATIGDVFGEQLPQLEESDAPSLLTLTIGGNVLLSAFSTKPRISLLEAIARDVADAYEFLLDALHRARPNAHVVVATIYDPSDGTGHIPGVLEQAGPLPLPVLSGLNDRIRTLASSTPRTALADVHAHFMGHGVTAPEDERWYWKRSLIEPNALGANEIRRLWRKALDRA